MASQFNCLEMVGPGVRPEDGITMYASDATQGPACAMSCPAGTVFRNYFVNGTGQGKPANQVDTLSKVGEVVDNEKEKYWRMSNGYCLPTQRGSIAKLHERLEKNPHLHEAVREALQVGIHWDTEVVGGRYSVCQVFCSALPISYASSLAGLSEWKLFGPLVLDANMEATLATAAILALRRKARVTVFLTAVGGGAFGNPSIWIAEAIERAMRAHLTSPIDVKLVSYGAPPGGKLAELSTKFEGPGGKGRK